MIDRAAQARRGPTEEMIASVWCEILGLTEVGSHENFFELGGHSLFATRVISQLRACFDIDVPLRVLFDNPTVRQFGEFIENSRQAGRRKMDSRREEALF